MTEAERDSYRRQFDQVVKRIPKRHVVTRCEWRHGQLTVEHGPPQRQAAEVVDRKTRQSLLI